MKVFQKKNFKIMSLIFAISLTSCNINTQNSINEELQSNTRESETENTEQYVQLEEVTMAMKPFTTLNPLLVEDVNVATTLNLVYDTLFQFDSGMKQTPLLVDDYYYDANSHKVVLGIKEDIYFSNGDLLTPYDVIYSLNTLKNAPNTAYYKKNLKGIYSYNVVNGKVELYLNSNTSFFDLNLVIPVISKEVYEGINHSLPYGTGEYFLGEEEKYGKFSFVKNEFSTKDLEINKINIEVLSEDEKALVAFDKELFDIATSDMNSWLQYKENPNVTVNKINTNDLEFVGFNYNNEFLQNIKIREGLKYAVPYNKTISDIYLDFAKITNTGVNPSSWLYNEISQSPIFDIDYSKKIFEDQGFIYDDSSNLLYLETTNENGELEKKYLSFKMIVNEENIQRTQFATLFKNQLTKIGVDVDLQVLSFEQYNDAIKNDDFDLLVGGIHLPENQNFMSIFQGKNNFNYSSSELNEYVNTLKNATTEEQYRNNMVTIQNYIVSNKVFLPILYKEDVFLCNGIIKDAFFAYENIYYNVESWKINQKVKSHKKISEDEI